MKTSSETTYNSYCIDRVDAKTIINTNEKKNERCKTLN